MILIVCDLSTKKNSVLHTQKCKTATEQDFVEEAWTPILSLVKLKVVIYYFVLCMKLTFKRCDSIVKASMAAKKRSLENDARAIGNHVNLRVLVQAKGTHEDALSDEFAGSIPGPQKFTGDHVKIHVSRKSSWQYCIQTIPFQIRNKMAYSPLLPDICLRWRGKSHEIECTLFIHCTAL